MAKKKDKPEEGRNEKGQFTTGNKFSVGLDSSGCPPIWDASDEESVQAFHDRVVDYFDYITGEKLDAPVTKFEIGPAGISEEDDFTVEEWKRYPEKPTITGLALHLGFSSKTTLYQYAKKPEFAYSIKRALSFVEKHYETQLNERAATGAIFALKNMGWKDVFGLDNNDDTDIPIATWANQKPDSE